MPHPWLPTLLPPLPLRRAQCLNEWAVLEGSNWQGFVELARSLLDAGAPLHCLGVQASTIPGLRGKEGVISLE